MDLINIKVGDRVVNYTRYYKSILEVTRVTKSLVICGTERYNKSNGQQIPRDTYGMSYITPLTPEKEKEIDEELRRNQCEKFFRTAIFDSVPIDKLEEMVEQVKSYSNVESN